MTIDEYTRALDRLSDKDYEKFNTAFGGGQLSRERRVMEFMEDPKNERRICQLLHLTTQEERLVHASLHSTTAAIISAVAAIIALALSVFSQWQAYDMTHRQLAISETPQLLIEPAENVKGEIGSFHLSLTNPSLADVHNVRVYEDYFVTITPQGGSTTFYRPGRFSVAANTNLAHVKRGEGKSFNISFKSIADEMDKIFDGDVKGARMKIAKLTVRFCRDLDGKEFTQKKAYIIAGDGDSLLDYDERGIDLGGMPTFSDLKRSLGVDNN